MNDNFWTRHELPFFTFSVNGQRRDSLFSSAQSTTWFILAGRQFRFLFLYVDMVYLLGSKVGIKMMWSWLIRTPGLRDVLKQNLTFDSLLTVVEVPRQRLR